ncbi:MAG TPA: hypothetical protein VK638_59105 [Edaphobacter sp.]|nr:hypothetical protein [Edaphobacter sp.]
MLPLAKYFRKSGQHRVLLNDPYNDPDEGERLEFRLTYEGLLLGASRTDTRSEHKHAIRKAIQPQLRRLWQVIPYLDFPQTTISQFQVFVNVMPEAPKPRSVTLAEKYTFGGFRFVPLVTEELSLICGIEVLFLRPDHPGGVIRSGDIDNRLKTLFDALRMPSPGQVNDKTVPADGEDPFYVLLEDDRLVTKISVETDTLLQPTGDEPDVNDARLVITVKLRPATLSC